MEIDNNTVGFDEAFQPSIEIQKKSDGYVEFQVDFVNAGTSTPKIQNSVPVTCINVNGATYSDGIMNEKDQVNFFPGYYDYLIGGDKLEITLPDSYVSIKNTSGIRHAITDTSSKDLMATVVNKNISGFKLRIGAKNTSPTISEVRTRSVYFKTFYYGHMTTLPNRTMLSLSGAKNQNVVELKGKLSASHSYNIMFIERAISPDVFGVIEKIDISGKSTAEYSFTYLDTKPGNGVIYYRIRLVGTNTNVQEISNTLMVKVDNNQNDMNIINTLLQSSNPVITIQSREDNEADLQVADMNGRIVNKTRVKLNNGINNIMLSGFFESRGYFVVIVNTKNKTFSQKIMIE
jgi:hypothetical protein